jgi:hypothetical protein
MKNIKLSSMEKMRLIQKRKRQRIVFTNVAEGTHRENMTFPAGEVIGSRGLLVRLEDGAVKIAEAAHQPIGTVTDEAEQVGDPINVHLLSGASTVLMVAAAPVTEGAIVMATAGGKILPLGTAPGTYHPVGVALHSAEAAGDVVEVLSALMTPITVAPTVKDVDGEDDNVQDGAKSLSPERIE